MIAVLVLTAICVCCIIAAIELAGADWPWRGPRIAILLWQAIGLAWGIAAIGALLAVGLAPYGRGVALGLAALAADAASGEALHRLGPFHLAVTAAGLTLAGLLVWVLGASAVAVLRARRRHRTLLALVGRGDPEVPGALVVDHPAATAYCVPGVRSHVVVSAGTLRLLDRSELLAVLDHERAHARERHDLVLLPFTALRRAFPGSTIVRDALDSVSLLIEMAADDRVRQARRTLATALLRIGVAGHHPAPSGTLGLAEVAVAMRVARLLRPTPALSRSVRAAVLAAATALVLAPLVLLCVPF